MKKCGSCGFENPEEGKFCRKCGTKLEEKKLAKFCRFCGKEAAEGTLFCTGCGKSLQMTADNTTAQPKQPVVQPKQPAAQPQQSAMQPKQEAEKKNLLPIIVAVVILLAALVVGGIWLANSGLLGNGDSEKENDRIESQVSEEERDENKDDENTDNEISDSTENVEDTEYTEDTEYIEESTEYEIEETETTEIAEETSEYILPTSNSEYLTMEDLQGLTAEECRIARNELYARYGRKFLDEALMEYFESKSWYTGVIEPEDFNDLEWLNEYEIANRDLIVEYETLQGYR